MVGWCIRFSPFDTINSTFLPGIVVLNLSSNVFSCFISFMNNKTPFSSEEHLPIFISVISQLDAQNFLFYNKFISCLYMFRAHVFIIRRSNLYYTASGIITPIGSRPVHGTATYRCDDTRGCVMQFWPPDDEHMCSKRVEAWNKLIVKQKILCIKLVNYWDKYTEMHGQQNDKYTEMHGQ